MSEGLCKVECRPLGRIYYNAENGYTVASFLTEEELPKEVKDSEERSGAFRATGEELPAEDGLTVELCGRWKKTNYGMQLDVKSFHIRMPTSVDGIRKYLSSGLIKGIGPVTAGRIVDKFGKDAFEVMEKEPKRLLEIRGITQTKLYEILDGYRQSMSIRELMTYLSPGQMSLLQFFLIFSS